MSVIAILLILLAAYTAFGLVFAIAFVFRHVYRLDSVAAHAPLRFRLLILPGAVALWPILARKLRAARKDHP